MYKESAPQFTHEKSEISPAEIEVLSTPHSRVEGSVKMREVIEDTQNETTENEADFNVADFLHDARENGDEETVRMAASIGVSRLVDGLGSTKTASELLQYDSSCIEGALSDYREVYGEEYATESRAKIEKTLTDMGERLILEANGTTAEAYMSVALSEMRQQKNNPESWGVDRQEFHTEEIKQAAIAAAELSKKLGEPPRIIAMRGGCGSGKSFAVKSIYGENDIFDSRGDVPGAVKPDYFKERIKLHEELVNKLTLTSEQVHMESTALNYMFMNELAYKESLSLLIDKQLEGASDIPDLVELGKETNKSVELLDNDVPLELSAFRVLKREVGGTDPNIRLDGVAAGFQGIRANRGEVYDLVNKEDIVTKYSLRAFDPESKTQIEVAKKINGQIKPISGYEDLAISVIAQDVESVEAEIQNVKDIVISTEYVDSFVERFFDDSERGQKGAQDARRILGAYTGLGMTIEQAMRSKADGIEADSEGREYSEDYREQLVAWLEEESNSDKIERGK